MSFQLKVPINLEIQIKNESLLKRKDISQMINLKFQEMDTVFKNGPFSLDDFSFPIEYVNSIDSIEVCDLLDNQSVSFWQATLCIHTYRLSDQDPDSDYLEGEEELPASLQWELPNKYLNGLWNSIVIDTTIKNRLLSYCSSSIQFSDCKIDPNIISWNRMVLIHGIVLTTTINYNYLLKAHQELGRRLFAKLSHKRCLLGIVINILLVCYWK